MNDFKVTTENEVTLLETGGYRVRVDRGRVLNARGGAILAATLYREEGSFVPVADYLFELLPGDIGPLSNEDKKAVLHNSIGFFFNSLLDTDYFIINMPKLSGLYEDAWLKAAQDYREQLIPRAVAGKP